MISIANTLRRTGIVLLAATTVASGPAVSGSPESSGQVMRHGLITGEVVPTGMHITPTVARGAHFQALNPDLPTRPDYLVDHAVSTAVSPNGKTLLVLTSGYNRNYDPAG